MKNLLNKPHLISWVAIPVLLALGLVFPRHTIDIQLADTYFVIGNIHFTEAGSLLLLVTGFGYWLLNRTGKTPNQVLIAIHLVLTIGVILALAIPIADSFIDSDWFAWSLVALLFGQGLYSVNVLLTLLFGTTNPPKL